MEVLYMMLGFLLVSFGVLLFVMHSCEEKVSRRSQIAVDPMFRRGPSVTGGGFQKKIGVKK